MMDQNGLTSSKKQTDFISNGQGLADILFVATNRYQPVRSIPNTSPKYFEVNTWIRNLNFNFFFLGGV